MKIKIHKSRKFNKLVIEEGRLNEIAPAVIAAAARLGPLLAK